MSTEPAVLQSFVPSQLLNWLAEQASPLSAPTSKNQQMVVWFADLHDFTRTTHEITEREKAGPEVVTELLNRTFGPIIETITSYGGEVLEFAGDSVLATWTIKDGTDSREALIVAGLCSSAVLELDSAQVYPGQPSLKLRIGIGLGQAALMQLGGVDGRWHFVIGGGPFDQIGLAVGEARPGQVVLSPEATVAIGGAAEGDLNERGFLSATHFDQVEPPSSPTPHAVSSSLAADLRRFVSPAEITRIDAGQDEWLGEFRWVTSVFINLPLLDPARPGDRDTLQDVVVAAQTALATYEGTMNRVLADDKGITIIATFGLPPYAHEEDPYLAVQAAEEIQTALKQMKLDYGIGLATGRAFCGAYGSSIRRNYTTIGREVNLAARLMRTANFEILCDEATAGGTHRIEFHALGDRRIRGWDQPVRLFRPLWEKAGTRVDSQQSAPLLGREAEQDQLIAWLGALDRAHNSAVVVVEGEAGIGKSALAADLLRAAKSFNVQTLHGAALPVAQPPYQAWRDVIEEVLGLTNVRSLSRRQEMVRRRLAEWPQFAQWEALLNSVLDLQFPESATTRGMSGSNRRESTVELLVALLSEAAVESPLLIVLDDLHWFDSASWAAAIGVARKVSPLLLLLLTRPMLEDQGRIEELTALGTSAHLVLNPISEQNALDLAKERLGSSELEPDVARVIVEAAEGIPFYIEELAFSLRDAGALTVEDGVVKLTRSDEELGVPHTLSSVLLSRIDQLSPELQITLKVASVIGRSFDTRALEAVHPSHPGVDELASELSQLSLRELIVESSPGSYDFKHSLIRDAAYDLLLFDQRRRIHRSVGTFVESLEDQPQDPLYSLLAYHWEQAEDHQKALGYFEKAGASSLRKGANREAIDQYSKCLDLVRQHPYEFGDVARLRRSQWHVEIGQSYEGMGNHDEAEASFSRALDLVGVRVSTKSVEKVGRLLWETMRQVLHITLPWATRVPRDDEERARLGQAAHVAALIAEVYFFLDDLLSFTALSLISINLGEKAGQPLVAGLAYSTMGWMVGTFRLKRLANRYFSRARQAEELETNPEVVPPSQLVELQEMGPSHLIAMSLAEGTLKLQLSELDRARATVTEGLDRCERLGDKYSAGIALAIRGLEGYCSGRLDHAYGDYTQLLTSATMRSNEEHEGWARSLVIPVLLAFNREDRAQAMASAATAILDSVDPLTVPVIHGTRSQVQMRAGLRDEARVSAEMALEAIDGTPYFIYLAGFAGMLDTFLGLWGAETDLTSRSARELAKLTRKALKKMRMFALVLPFARPKYQLFKGRMEHLAGRTGKARRSLGKGLGLAEEGGFAWDAGLLHMELARSSPAQSAKRESHLTEARLRFEQVGSLHDLDQVTALEVG